MDGSHRPNSTGEDPKQTNYRKHSVGNGSNHSENDLFKKPYEVSTSRRSSGVSNYFSKAHNDNVNFITRSGSFSTDFDRLKPMNPVKRSKSQLTLNGNEPKPTVENGNMSRSSSLYDVSDGLQSLEVSVRTLILNNYIFFCVKKKNCGSTFKIYKYFCNTFQSVFFSTKVFYKSLCLCPVLCERYANTVFTVFALKTSCKFTQKTANF